MFTGFAAFIASTATTPVLFDARNINYIFHIGVAAALNIVPVRLPYYWFYFHL